MVKAIVLFVALLMLSGSVLADGFIGLYSDGTHTSCAANGVGMYPVEMWIWCKPDPSLGMICAEFMISYPANVIQSTVTWNDPIISVWLGDLPSGLSICFIVCQWDWTWIAHQTIYVTDPTQTMCQVWKHPDPGIPCVSLYDCTPGYPGYCVGAYPRLWLNHPNGSCADPIATEETSWGAIKSIYGD